MSEDVFQRRVTEVQSNGVAVNPVGAVGGVFSLHIWVVAVAAFGSDSFPAASVAEIVYE
jgi:hypothetical protein